jgi:ATP synthase protein I
MTGPDRSLDDLGKRIAKAREAGTRQSSGAEGQAGADEGIPKNALGLGFRIGVELVSAVAVGLFLGWLIDGWLGTRPWFMVAFFFLGAGAGIMNVYRTVNGMGMAVGYRPPDRRDETGGKADSGPTGT